MAVASKKIPAPDLVPVRRALISVSDKTGLVEFAAALARAGVDLISTGGTLWRALQVGHMRSMRSVMRLSEGVAGQADLGHSRLR